MYVIYIYVYHLY